MYKQCCIGGDPGKCQPEVVRFPDVILGTSERADFLGTDALNSMDSPSSLDRRGLVCAIGRCRDRGRCRVKNNVEQFL